MVSLVNYTDRIMKPLKRPMFRSGGPIKEGIMSGIKEPRRQGYAQPPGFVILTNSSNAFGLTCPKVKVPTHIAAS